MVKKAKKEIAAKEIFSKDVSAIGNVFRIHVFLIASLCVILYANTLNFGYTLDDTLMITGNDYTLMGVSGIPEILTTDAFAGFLGKDKNLLPGGRYRPLSHIMFAIEYEIFGLNPFMGHLLNVLLYAFGCLLVFIVLRRFLLPVVGKEKGFMSIAFIASLLFASHPLHTEVVANIKGRDEILSMILLFAALYFSDKYIISLKKKYLFAVTACFFPALLAKENAFTFLIIIPFSLWFFRKPKLQHLFISSLPLAVSALLYAILRINAIGIEANTVVVTELLNDPFLHASTVERYATVFYTWLIYLKLLIFPHPLTHDYYPYHIAITNFADIKVWLSIAIYTFLLVYALKNISKRSLVAYGILFYGIIFSISSNLFFNIGAFMNERFIFLSILGFTLILSYLVLNKLKDYRLTIFIFSVILLAFSIKTFTRNFAWKDDFTLFTTDVKTSVNSAKVNVSAGGMLVEKAQKEGDRSQRLRYLNRATGYLTKGLEIHPRYTAGWVLLGNAYLELRQMQHAYTCYENALRLSPTNSDAINNMGVLLSLAANTEEFETAEKASRRLAEIFPDSLYYSYELASALLGQGLTDSSLIILEGLLEKRPQHYMAWCKLGELYGRYKNDIVSSELYLKKSAEIRPSYLPAQENLGIVYAMKGDYEKSRDYLLKALEIDDKISRIHQNISLTYLQLGDTLNAGIHRRRAVELESSKQ